MMRNTRPPLASNELLCAPRFDTFVEFQRIRSAIFDNVLFRGALIGNVQRWLAA
jgi:hypothetical protein